MSLNGRKINTKPKIVQMTLNNFIPTFDSSSNHDVSTENKIFLRKSAINNALNKNTQLTLFKKDAKILKISKNIQDFSEIWLDFFPSIINSHFALDQMGIMGITDGNSILEQEKPSDQMSVNFTPFFQIINKLKKLTKKLDSDDINIQLYNKFLFKIDPSQLEFILLIDCNNKIKNSRCNLEHVRFPSNKISNNLKSWGNSYRVINSDIISRDFGSNLSIYIIEKNSYSLEQIDGKYKEKHQNYFSLSQLYLLLKILKNLEDYKNKKIDKLNLVFYQSNLKIIPKFLNKNKKEKFGIFLARKIEILKDEDYEI